MPNFRQQLPPLDLLVAFESAARHLSFTLAAAELNVTQSAVSQQIRALEASLGVPLFERAHRSVRLTARGREFQNSVALALSHLANAAGRVKSAVDGPSLTVATDQSVAALWLLPRLPRFRARHPRVALRLVASDLEADCFAEEVQLAIVHGDGRWPGHDCVALFEEEVFPVCAPGHPAAQGRLADLASATLVDLEYERWHWMNWSIWLTEKGLDLPPARRRLQINSYPLVIAAALNGEGVALGWRHLVDDQLFDGTLVCPVAAKVRTPLAYHLVWQYNRPSPPEVEVFRAWLIEERDRQPLFPLAP